MNNIKKPGALTATLNWYRARADYCEEGKLLFSPDATHWVQREEAREVNQHLLEFISA